MFKPVEETTVREGFATARGKTLVAPGTLCEWS